MKDTSIGNRFYLQIQREVNRIEKKAKLNAFLFYFVRVTQIALTGAITILSKKVQSEGNVILVLGTLATVGTAIDTLFQFDAKKNVYKLILFELRAMRAEFVHADIQDKISMEFIDALFEKYKTFIAYAKDLIETD